MTNQELKEARFQMGLSQKNMALLLGMKQRHYSRLETGYENRKPTKQHARIVKILDFIHSKGLLAELIEYINET